MTLPVWCTYGLVLDNEGNFAAVTQAWFFFLALSIAYYDVKMVFFCAATTIGSTVGAFLFCPEAMLKLDSPSVWLYIFSVYVMAICFCAVIANRMRRILESTRKMKAYEDELVYLEQLQKKEEKHSEFIHNINHYFIAIGELARVEHCDQIVNLVEELNGSLLCNERIIYTTHKVLNAILSEKSNEALEAAAQCKDGKRKIFVKIFMEKEGRICVIKLVNNFATPRVQHKSGFISTKRNRKIHGIGLKSVEDTAKKYGGYLHGLIEDEKFVSILILPVRK